MKIHLIRSSEMDRERFTKVVDLLKAVPGPMAFGYDPQSIVDFDREEVREGLIPDRDHFEKGRTVSFMMEESMAQIDFPLRELTASWERIFSKCATYRKVHSIPDDEYVILLTDVRNDNNWFAALDWNRPATDSSTRPTGRRSSTASPPSPSPSKSSHWSSRVGSSATTWSYASKCTSNPSAA